jgi:serine/threonine-protein kinase RsbW
MQSGHVLTFLGTLAGFERAFGDLRRTLDGHPLQHEVRYKCELVFEEVVTNIIKHGYADNGREHGIEVALDFRDDVIVMSFEDDGVPFDPREQPSAERSGSILDVKVGGRGLSLVRQAARRMEYERTPQHRNRLTVTIAGATPF